LSYLTGMSEHNFLQSPHRDAVLELVATAPAEGVPVTAIMAVPGVGSRDNADHLLMRMVRSGEVTRISRGRYGPPPAPQIPAAPEPNGHAKDANGHHVAPKPVTPSADPGLPPGELVEKKLDIKADQPAEAPRVAFNFDTFVAVISAMYGHHGLCPPFRLRQFASAWVAAGISPLHCTAVTERHLREHAASRASGSADGLLPHLDRLIRYEWNNRYANGAPPRQPQARPKPGNTLDNWDDYAGRSKRRISGKEESWEGDY
jgi:hypothetical protein